MRHDFVVRVRYQNALPPPPSGPKLVESAPDFGNLTSASSLSGVVYGQGLDPEIAQDLGMPIDLVQAPHAFEDQMFALPEDPKIDPADLALLENPTGGVASVNSVAFLRRTEYSTGAIVRGEATRKRASLSQEPETPEQHVAAIEQSFDLAPLSELQHPKRRNLKAVKAWKVLPDTQQLDLDAKSVRMIGSAALSQNRRVTLSRDQLLASLFKTTTVDEDTWVSLFTPDVDAASSAELSKIQDYEVTTVAPKNTYDEVIFSLGNDTAYYLPLNGRVNLKRRRVEGHKKQKLEDHELDILHIEREPLTAEESNARDKKRSEYDPVSYE